MTNRIIIFDDDEGAADSWKRDIEDHLPESTGYTITAMVDQEFRNAITGLEKRRRSAREGLLDEKTLEPNPFDEAAILIVDYDLLKLYSEEYLTGEAVAYLARCYSKCGLIVALNQYGSNYFDLTLKGHSQSFADINVSGDQIRNLGLWTENCKGFRPWSWPVLPNAVEAFKRRVKNIEGHLDEPVLKYLDFPESLQRILPRAIVEHLDIGDKDGGKKIGDVTFREFVTRSGNGLRGKDASSNKVESASHPLPDSFIARIAGSRVAKWLERLVLPGQDILVDAPHLIVRYPSLAGEGDKSLHQLNASTSLASPAISELIAPHRFERFDWLSRPAWWWIKVREDERIAEVSDPWSISRLESVFCEDVSRFVPKSEAREFVADLSSPFTLRYVVDPKTSQDTLLVEQIKGIDYRPQIRFAL